MLKNESVWAFISSFTLRIRFIGTNYSWARRRGRRRSQKAVEPFSSNNSSESGLCGSAALRLCARFFQQVYQKPALPVGILPKTFCYRITEDLQEQPHSFLPPFQHPKQRLISSRIKSTDARARGLEVIKLPQQRVLDIERCPNSGWGRR